MSLRIMPAILAAAAAVGFGSLPANAQQTPPSLRLYVLDCGIITPPIMGPSGPSKAHSPCTQSDCVTQVAHLKRPVTRVFLVGE